MLIEPFLIAVDLITFLLNTFEDPVSYSILFFLYVILAAIILPIPVEIGLFNPTIHPGLLVLILAFGKGVGAFIVYFISQRVRMKFKSLSIGSNWMVTKKILVKLEGFVRVYGHYGLFIIMSIPLMVDSITLYLFSLLNPSEKKSELNITKFVVINIGAGAVRGCIIIAIFYLVGIQLI